MYLYISIQPGITQNIYEDIKNMKLQNADCGNNSIYRNVIKSFHNIYDNEF